MANLDLFTRSPNPKRPDQVVYVANVKSTRDMVNGDERAKPATIRLRIAPLIFGRPSPWVIDWSDGLAYCKLVETEFATSTEAADFAVTIPYLSDFAAA